MTDSRASVIVWFRADLRLADNPALVSAVEAGRPVLACYVLDEVSPSNLWPGGASRWWLHHSLKALTGELEARGVPFVLRRGATLAVLTALASETSADVVHTSASREPGGVQLENAVRVALQAEGTGLRVHPGALLFGRGAVQTQSGRPYRVFTPFWKACLRLPEPGEPIPAPTRIRRFAGKPDSERLTEWGLLPVRPNWAEGFETFWEPGEAGAHRRLETFIDDGMAGYSKRRDRPDIDGTSRLSPHLHFGELSPRQVWHPARVAMALRPTARAGGEGFLRQLGWREFSSDLLHHRPTLPHAPFRPEFEAFPWQESPELLERWRRGRTGYPIVDAGMRQLWRTGWMHNRPRMVAASFLVKHLLAPWQQGAAWFWDTLVDADVANNSASWQWVAGCGADAAPYFRIFNPMLQGKRFDPNGDYVRRWVPELARMPSSHIHEPWSAPQAVLDKAGVVLGRNYPEPIINHTRARERALAAYAKIKK